MSFFDHTSFDDHEQVCFCYCKKTGLKSIIAIHNTQRGPSLGGCRMWNYHNDEEALYDVLRLSQGMTYKSALAELPLGGGKSVIIGNPGTQKTPELIKKMGEFVESFHGRYIIAEDVGTSVEDMNIMRQTSHYVTGSLHDGRGTGDPSPVTAYGVFLGIQVAAAFQLGADSLKGVRVAVQGLGNVGSYLCQHLHDAGAQLIITDVNSEKIEKAVQSFPGTEVVAPDAIYGVEADIFSPCALGATLNDRTIDQLKTPIVAGGANNQLEHPQHGEALHQKGILYAPDYLVNAGGVISVYYEYAVEQGGLPLDQEWVMNHAAKIGPRLNDLLHYAKEHDISTAHAADKLAREVLKKSI